MTYTGKPNLSGSALTWNSSKFVFDTPPGIIRSYPAIDSNTIVAWTFSGSSGDITNLGAAGSSADMININSDVKRLAPGPVSYGIAFNGSFQNNRVYTASGSIDLGSSNFTDSITMMAIFKLYLDPTLVSPRRVFLKSHNSTWGSGGIFQGASIEFQGSQLTGIVQTNVGYRNFDVSVSSGKAFGFGYDGIHMVVMTYGTEGGNSVFRIYYDGVEIGNSSTTYVQSNLAIGAGSPNEGPWNVGGLFSQGNGAGSYDGLSGFMYHARAENVVRNADWVRQAWINFNGW